MVFSIYSYLRLSSMSYTGFMDKKLRDYMREINHRLDEAKPAEMADLRRYHAQRVSEFQHERLIHLIVTLFFGGLMLLSFGGVFAASMLGDSLLIWLTGALAVILLALEFAYVRYYFFLENNTQRLYDITRKLG